MERQGEDGAADGVGISVVIPVHDREEIVGRAIESVLGQTRAPLEIVVVDDGSTDGTAEEVRGFGERVRLVTQANAGAAEARNRGVREARGRWIAFLDSDDHWEAGHLARLAEAVAATDGRAAVYFTDTRRTPEDGSVRMWERDGFAIDGDRELVEDGAAWASLPKQPMMLQSSAIERDAYLACGGLMPELLSRHDTHLFFKLCLGRPTCAVAGIGAIMTSDGGSGRVTVGMGDRTARYWEETERMYADLLAGPYSLTAAQRRDLSERLATAHMALARFRWQAGQRARAGGHALRALRTSPGRFFAGVRRKLGLAGA